MDEKCREKMLAVPKRCRDGSVLTSQSIYEENTSTPIPFLHLCIHMTSCFRLCYEIAEKSIMQL